MFNFIIYFYFAYTRSFARILDIEVAKIAKLSNISRKSINKICKNIRILIAKECETISKMQGEIEIDEIYFGAKRVRGKRGLGADKKNFCIFASPMLATASRREYAKHRLSKFKGIKKENFMLHIKETEFRYNVKIQGQDLYKILLKMIRKNPLKLG